MWILGSEIDKLAGRKLQRDSSTLSTSSIPVSKHPEVFKVSLSSPEVFKVSLSTLEVFKVSLSSPEVLKVSLSTLEVFKVGLSSPEVSRLV